MDKDTQLIIQAIKEHSPNGEIKELATRMDRLESAVRDIPTKCALHAKDIKHNKEDLDDVKSDVKNLQSAQGRQGVIATGLTAIGVVLGFMFSYLIEPIAKFLAGKGGG
jgi:hypothetical protein